MPKRTRRIGVAARDEQFAGPRHRRVKRQRLGRLQRFDQALRGTGSALCRRKPLAKAREQIGCLPRRDGQVAGATQHGPLGLRRRKGHRSGSYITLGNHIDQLVIDGSLQADGLARSHEFQGSGQAAQARQADRATGTRDEAERDLREAERQVRRGHSIVTGESQFGAATKRRAMQRRHHQLG